MTPHPLDARFASPRRRRLLTGGAAGLTLTGSGGLGGLAALLSPRTARALPVDATERLLAARLAEQGTGLAAVQAEADGSVAIAVAGKDSGDRPLPRDARFEIGSLTKTFTGLLLADAGVRREVALDGAVEEAIGDGIRLRDAAGQPIRWVDLATHRSGLPRLADNMAPANPADPYADYDDARLLAFLRTWKPTVNRDTRWAYSNLGYGLLGWALGRRAGPGYGGLLTARVLQPLGLTESALARPGTPVTGLVDGHDPERRPVPHWTFGDTTAGAGALVMSTGDIGRYLRALLAPAVTPLAEAIALAQRPHADGPTAQNPMGLGWIIASLNGRTVLNHDGGTYGFSTSTWLDPQRQRGTSVLANASVEVNDLALHLLEPTIPPKDFAKTRQAEIRIEAVSLTALAGRYAVSPQFAIEVTARDGQLWAQATGQGAFQLFASAPRRWFAKVTPLEITFDSGNPAPALTLAQGGRETRFVRAP